jgi:hypothetical protein
MEAAMITRISSRVAIQARIAESQREYRDSDYRSTTHFLRSPGPEAERVRWLRAA